MLTVMAMYNFFYCFFFFDHLLQDLYCVRSDLGNLFKALGRLEEAKVTTRAHWAVGQCCTMLGGNGGDHLITVLHRHQELGQSNIGPC